ncbi:T9SS type A sorting domain-containing protein [bacterium]|nr:T9SS type A sorting domain-containing protein [bacterium]
MKTIAGVMTAILLAACAFGQAIPPINLNADLLLAGEVSLTWEPPPDGLVEDFNDGVADGFDYYPADNIWYVDDGYLKCNSWSTWKSAWFTNLDFDDFTLEGEFVNSVSTNSRGLLFRADGPQATGSNGYAFYVAYNAVNYAVYRYDNGSLTLVNDWTPSSYINTGVGDSNRLKVVGSGSSFDLYINDNYVSSFTDATYPTGMVGAVASSIVETWYDEITCLYGAVMVPEAEQRAVEPGVVCDEFGQPLDDQVSRSTPVLDVAQSGSASREIDEFIEYRVYRDGSFIGATTTEAFTDYLPQPGEYEYTVTAYYDPEGESSPAGPMLVNWEPVVLTLTGQITTVPPEGGLIYYDASLLNTLPQTFNNVNWWTSVILPNGQAFGPLAFQNVTIQGFMDVTIQGLAQNIPELAPTGVYTFYGNLGFFPNSIVSDSFEFEKLGVGTSAIAFDPADWVSEGEFALAADGETAVALPSAYSLSAAYPNPFNPSTSFSVSLPDAAELSVTVYNIASQRVATLADGMTSAGQHEYTFDASGLASGLYFVQAVVPGQLNEIRKVTLLR